MIDFNDQIERRIPKYYGGANGQKYCVVMNDEKWMLKVQSRSNHNQNLSYANDVISEHIGSSIYHLLGIEAQQTKLGYYAPLEKGKQYLAVACKDFVGENETLFSFSDIPNSLSLDTKYKVSKKNDLDSILLTIHEFKDFSSKKLENRFWDMFVVDALIGNRDRHSGNWGLILSGKTEKLRLAPVFDCGSSLCSHASLEDMQKILSHQGEMNNRTYNSIQSILRIKEKKIHYYEFLTEAENKECNEALKRIVPKINLNQINQMIEEIEVISPIQKEFYQRFIKERKEKILDVALKNRVI